MLANLHLLQRRLFKIQFLRKSCNGYLFDFCFFFQCSFIILFIKKYLCVDFFIIQCIVSDDFFLTT